jgi:site-specific DNA-methyltransferase (adenine-specific)
MMSDNRPYMPTKAGSEEWETPQWLFDELNKEFDFTLDACATEANAKCRKFFTKEQDSLKQSWAGETVWCNPPYSAKMLTAFVDQAFTEALLNNILVVLLVPAKTDQKWFHYLWNTSEEGMEIEFRWIQGRLKFSGAKYAATFPSLVVVLDGRSK